MDPKLLISVATKCRIKLPTQSTIASNTFRNVKLHLGFNRDAGSNCWRFRKQQRIGITHKMFSPSVAATGICNLCLRTWRQSIVYTTLIFFPVNSTFFSRKLQTNLSKILKFIYWLLLINIFSYTNLKFEFIITCLNTKETSSNQPQTILF